MDLLKTPSVQSLLDSDLESVESFQYLDVDELDELEYALPSSDVDTPSLAEVLSAEDDLNIDAIPQLQKNIVEPATCSVLQTDILQAVSQQLLQAQERSSAGVATTLSAGKDGRITVGTAHGHLLSFHDQILRWVCDSNTEGGAVSCLAYNNDSSRLLAGYARGLVCQYESLRGVVLRRVTLGCDIWGTLKVTWAGVSALALDTGGSVWLIKFLRPLGVRSSRISCLFSGARGEVVAMSARDAHVLALATLSRVIIVAGGRAAGIRLKGPPDTLPVLEWSENNDWVLVCARANTLQWLNIIVTGSSINIRSLQRFELKITPLWLGWLGGSLAIFDVDENLRIWGDDYDKSLDLSHVEPIYASAFFKGFWTDGRVSRAMCMAGGSALGGVCVLDGALLLLGRRGVVRVRPRDLVARANSLFSAGRYLDALRLLCSAKKSEETKTLANSFVINISDRPHILRDKHIANQTVKLCLKYDLCDELWSILWEQGARVNEFVESIGDAIVRGEFSATPPSPDATQALIEKLAEFEPSLVERVVASLPLKALDPHRATVFTRERRLWRGLAAVATALDGASGALFALVPYVSAGCGGGANCECAGGALLLAAADALAGRAAGHPLPNHARPSASHDALQKLLADQEDSGGKMSPLRALVQHEAAAAVRLLEQSARDPPFAGPLAKQNRLRVAKALLAITPELPKPEDRVEILEFIANQLNTSALPTDQELIKNVEDVAAQTPGERADRAWVSAVRAGRAANARLAAARDRASTLNRPRLLARIAALLHEHDEALRQFFLINDPSATDVEELFDYIYTNLRDEIGQDLLRPYLRKLIELRPAAVATMITDRLLDTVPDILNSTSTPNALIFGDSLLEMGKLRGDSVNAYFKNLCILRPSSATDFLGNNPGLLRPEDALAIVREVKLTSAEPICLEAMGDAEGALDTILRIASTNSEELDEESRGALLQRASELCARVSPTIPPAAAGVMWTRLLRCAAAMGVTRPNLLLDAVTYLPVEETIVTACGSPAGALTILECAASQLRAWQCVGHIGERERYEGLVRALRTARRGVAARGPCARCGGTLAGYPARTAHCARAFHATCPVETTCALCHRPVPETVYTLPSRPRRMISPLTKEQNLLLFAPPRPDLEGVF